MLDVGCGIGGSAFYMVKVICVMFIFKNSNESQINKKFWLIL